MKESFSNINEFNKEINKNKIKDKDKINEKNKKEKKNEIIIYQNYFCEGK